MTVVYVDVLFLINFCMDFLALCLAGAILHLPHRTVRLIIAAALGGVYAVASALFGGYVIPGILIGMAMAWLLCEISYGGRCARRRFFALLGIFFVTSWLLGGMITAFYSLLARFFEKREELLGALLAGDGRLVIFFVLALFCAMLLGIGRRRFAYLHKQRAVLLTLREGERTKSVTALVDSGNTLCDPLSGRPCIVLDSNTAREVIPADILNFSESEPGDPGVLSAESRRRIRLIPARSLGGSRLLVGYRPTDVIIGEGTAEAHSVDAVVVLDHQGGSGFCGYGALVPSVLIF